jgi:hypothetical protein
MWRVGRGAPADVYDGDRFVCQCVGTLDARVIVEAMNRVDQTFPLSTILPKEVKARKRNA